MLSFRFNRFLKQRDRKSNVRLISFGLIGQLGKALSQAFSWAAPSIEGG
jgi:hypothetical protein